jgi:hypothetical protein
MVKVISSNIERGIPLGLKYSLPGRAHTRLQFLGLATNDALLNKLIISICSLCVKDKNPESKLKVKRESNRSRGDWVGRKRDKTTQNYL